jgi:Tol biopolymer transport system component
MLSEDGSASDVWSYDLARGTKTRLSSGPGYKNAAAWQADGQAVFFSTALGDVWQVYRIKSDGTGVPETVLKSESAPDHPESACRGGRYLAFSRSNPSDNPSDKTSLWILPLAGDREPFPLLQSQASTREAAFSPDCNWVAYCSNESGRFEVFLTHFPDATRKYLVSTDGGRNPHWRGDGKELFYYSPERKSLIAVSVEKRGGEELALGTPQALFSAPVAAVLGNLYDATSDGKRFLFSGIYSSSGDVPLTLVMNWDAELKRR